MSEATDGNSGGTSQVLEQAQELVGQAQEKAQQTARRATDAAAERVRTQVQTGAAEAAEQIGAYTTALRRTADGLHAEGQTGPATAAERVVERLEGLGEYLGSTDPDRMLADVEAFGRRRPWLVIAGGITVGFLASRVLKASSRARMDDVVARRTWAPPIPPGGEAPAAYRPPSTPVS